MTARQLYEYALVELNKVEAPSMLLEDFVYFANKSISQYINLHYNIYDANQLASDDLRVLKATAVLKPTSPETNEYGDNDSSSLYGNIYEVDLPNDYLHILNCICDFTVKKSFKCYDAGTHVQFAARRLTSDMWSLIINNFYMRPMYKRPYFFIHNVNVVDSTTQVSSSKSPTNPLTLKFELDETSKLYKQTAAGLGSGTDPEPVLENVTVDGTTEKVVRLKGLSRLLNSDSTDDLVEHIPTLRYGNPSAVRMEIRYGKDDSVFQLDKIYVDYLKTPQYIRLTQEQLDTTEDTSQMLEFPDYVCQEIVNGLVKLIMENSSDPRLQTNMAISLTIASPVQGLSASK